MSLAYALYRYPHADHYYRLEGDTKEYYAYSQLDGVSGFVVAPFEVRTGQPIVVISERPTASPSPREGSLLSPTITFPQQHHPQQHNPQQSNLSHLPWGGVGGGYPIDFANFHAQLERGTFRKIVLARCVDETLPEGVTPETLFHRACQLYPRLFIALVYTPQSGLWLTATPEVLLEGGNGHWHTIALAGTMQLTDDQLGGEGETVTWSTKNIAEQRIVATYIAECLEQFSTDFVEEGPCTVRAANLVHLRSDFTFTLPDDSHLGTLLGQLHPTPAVCGLPKRDALRFIVSNEHTPRRYYSGFQGPLNIDGDTHLYVSLRCMNIEADRCHLYAGGGLLKDSQMQQEWQETEAKLQTMRRLLDS